MAASVKASIQLYNGMSPALKSMQQALNLTISSFERLQSVSNDPVNLSAIAAAKNELSNVAVAVNKVEQEFKEAAQESQKLKGSVSGIKGLLGGLGIGAVLKGAINLSDTWTSTTARLNLMNDGLQTTQELTDKIYASAQRSRAGYLDTAAAVSKLGILAKGAFSSNDEIIAFTELMNKNFKIGGASIQEQSSAMYQLTQAMASGRLQGDEYRSIIENAPLLANAIEDYMVNVQKAKGTMKDWASEGKLTADVIKAALFSSADVIEERFAQMPRTWGDVWTSLKNGALMALQPVLEFINFLANNWETLEPFAVGLLAVAVAYGVMTAATKIATAENAKFIASLMANPLMWIVLLIGLVVMAIYEWVKSVGGIKIAWLIACDTILTAWDKLKIGFFTGVYFVISFLDKMLLAFAKVTVGIVNFIGDMKAGVLVMLETMINGAIRLINEFITAINGVTGKTFELIPILTFGATAAIENEALKQSRNENLAAFEDKINKAKSDRDKALSDMKNDAHTSAAKRKFEISRAKADAAASATDEFDFSGVGQDVSSIADNTKSISDSLDKSEEQMEYLIDIAEREAINRFTTAEVKVDFTSNANINSNMDIDGVINTFADRLQEALIISSEGVYV